MPICFPRDADGFSSRGIFPNLLNSVFPLSGKEAMLGNHADIIRRPFFLTVCGAGSVSVADLEQEIWR